MPLSEFLAQVDFLTPMFFRISVAAELALRALALSAQTASPSQDCRPLGRPWDSLNAQAPLAKIDIRSKSQPGSFLRLTRILAGVEYNTGDSSVVTY